MEKLARRNFWGWGETSESPQDDELREIADLVTDFFDIEEVTLDPAPELDSITMTDPRIDVPSALGDFATQRKHFRAINTYGRGFPDLIRGFRGNFEPAPDLVVFPRTEHDIIETFNWAESSGSTVIPVGGGTNVVRATEPGATGGDLTVALNMRSMNRVKQVDPVSRTARIQAGATGPELEQQLRGDDLTLRHYPQSFEFSTVGGWIATRAAGHFATVETRIDDFVNGVRSLSPAGVTESQSRPASGAGPDPDGLMLGSEGTLGVITEATLRVRKRPGYRARATVAFDEFSDAVGATRALARSSLHPANARLLSQDEVLLYQLSDTISNLLFLGFESPNVPVGPDLERARSLCENFGGRVESESISSPENDRKRRDESESNWREAFFRGPYLFNGLVRLGMIVDTIETCCSWRQFEDLHQNVMTTARDTFEEITGGGFITCRFTHLYPEGPAPYYTLVAPGKHNGRIQQWRELKEALSEVIHESGGTITHHHAVGRVHKPWYERETPELFRTSLSKVKTQLDPGGMLNPGVLYD